MSRKQRIDGDGSVYQRHAKTCERPTDAKSKATCKCPFVAVVVLGYREGKPIRKQATARTRAAAAAKAREMNEQRDANELPQGKTVTVEQWALHWLRQIAPRKNKASTLETYTTIIEQYVVPLIGHHRLDRLTPEHIDGAWDRLLEEGNPTVSAEKRRPLSANTVHLSHTVLRRALKVAVQRKRLRVNPAGSDSMDAPARVEKEVEPIPAADVEKILDAAETDTYGARWSVALALGLRPAEALGLRWEDVDLDEGVLHVRQQLVREKGKGLVATTPKSEAGRRSMFLPASLHAAMKAHRKAQTEARLLAGDHWHDTGLVFTLADGRAIDGHIDRDRWHALCERAGVTRRRLYDARHSAATLLLVQGVELRTVMALLGHSQISVTMKYQHAVDELKAEAARRIESGMWGDRAN